MKGIDTNILVRLLVGDDERQAKKAYAIFKEAELNKNELFVSLLVILELIWVLESAYKIDRNKIIGSISDLLLLPILRFEHLAAIQKFILKARDSGYDLSDLLIAQSASEQGCKTLLTFDKKASKCALFELA